LPCTADAQPERARSGRARTLALGRLAEQAHVGERRSVRDQVSRRRPARRSRGIHPPPARSRTAVFSISPAHGRRSTTSPRQPYGIAARHLFERAAADGFSIRSRRGAAFSWSRVRSPYRRPVAPRNARGWKAGHVLQPWARGPSTRCPCDRLNISDLPPGRCRSRCRAAFAAAVLDLAATAPGGPSSLVTARPSVRPSAARLPVKLWERRSARSAVRTRPSPDKCSAVDLPLAGRPHPPASPWASGRRDHRQACRRRPSPGEPTLEVGPGVGPRPQLDQGDGRTQGLDRLAVSAQRATSVRPASTEFRVIPDSGSQRQLEHRGAGTCTERE